MSDDERRLRTLIVEDEPEARRSLRDALDEVDWIEVVGEAVDGRTASRLFDELSPDLVFLDVRLPERSGLEALAAARHRPDVVFTTAHDEFALTAFELGALDYLLKPFGRRRLETALERVRRRRGSEAQPAAAERARAALERPLRRLFARTPRGIVPVEVASIRHLRASGDFVEVHAQSGKFLLQTPLSALAERLDPERFVRVHRSHVVNLDAVELLATHDERRLVVHLAGGTRIVASRAASERLRSLVR